MASIRVAVTQAEPIWLDLAGSVKKAIELIEEAAKGGARIVAFAEAWIPGYPAWIWLVSNFTVHVATQSLTDAGLIAIGRARSTLNSRRDISTTRLP